jgi:hypothetical protein
VAASVFVFQIDGVETKFLLANSITEFSHGLGLSVVSRQRSNMSGIGGEADIA